MKHLSTLFFCLICVQLFACNKSEAVASNSTVVSYSESMKLKITVGTNSFTATLSNNETVKAFKARLPFTLTMAELNGNEKYFDFAESLPANASNPGMIQSGDLMLYGGKTLVLFYKSFSTSYSYTRIAKIDNASGLAAALGSGSATVKFELK